SFQIDEIGKFPFGKVYEAAKPAFMSKYGLRVIPLLLGCVCAGTKVWTNDGRLVNIEDLEKKEGILGYNGEGYSKEPITHLNPPRKKKCYKITTTSGNYIECSEDHPLLTSGKEKTYIDGIHNVNKVYFKPASDIKIGDRLYKIDNLPLFGKKRESNARLLGLLVGDGYYGHSCSLSIDNEDIYTYINKRYDTKIHKTFLTKSGEKYREVRINGVQDILRKSGMKGQSKQKKTLPVDIYQY